MTEMKITVDFISRVFFILLGLLAFFAAVDAGYNFTAYLAVALVGVQLVRQRDIIWLSAGMRAAISLVIFLAVLWQFPE